MHGEYAPVLYFGVNSVDKTTNVSNRGGVEDTRLEAKAKDSPSEDRLSRGQGQECSRPRTEDTGASVLQKKIFFQAISKKRSSKKLFLALELRSRGFMFKPMPMI